MKRALLAAAAVSTVSPLLAQGFGAPQILSSVGAYYGDPITADLDGDGDQDVIVFRWFTPTSGPTDYRIVWLANDGAGNFGAQQTVTTAVLTDTELHAADLDGDGDIDLISAQTQQGKLAYYLNDGAGNFGSQQIIPGPAVTAPQTGWSPYSIDTADFDGDGDLDILTGYYILFGPERVAWYANDGAANFSTAQIIDTTAAIEVRAGDLDGDGDEDVLGCTYLQGSSVALYWLNDGTGAFGPMQSVTPGGSGKFTLGDHDGDGDLDFVPTALGSGNAQSWVRNDGQANFSFGSNQYVQAISPGVCSPYGNLVGGGDSCSADFDGDGKTDFLVSGGNIAWWSVDGSNPLDPISDAQFVVLGVPSNNCIEDVVWSHAADLDGDGDQDVLFTRTNASLLYWCENQLPGPVVSTATAYGAGCGTPPMALTPTSTAIVGQSITATISAAPTQFGFGSLGFSDTSAPGLGALPLDLGVLGMPGCALYHSTDVFGLPTTPSSTASQLDLSWSVPMSSLLVGARLYLQVWCIAPGANAFQWVTSNGVDYLIGNQ